MKRILAVLLVLLTLTGCSGQSSELDRAMELRQRVLSGNGCTFDAVITADYGEKIYTFGMKCAADAAGNITFEVTQPETISGITGTISDDVGKLTFDEYALAFEMLADGQITPVSAAWLMIRSLRSGYVSACGKEGDGLYIQIDDSYLAGSLQMDIWTNETDLPVRVELIYQSKRIVSIDVENFTFV